MTEYSAPFVGSSRAVVRLVDPGNEGDCAWCGEPVTFRARIKRRRVIANCYVDGRWDRVEVFHHGPERLCYLEAGEPYGPAREKAA